MKSCQSVAADMTQPCVRLVSLHGEERCAFCPGLFFKTITVFVPTVVPPTTLSHWSFPWP